MGDRSHARNIDGVCGSFTNAEERGILFARDQSRQRSTLCSHRLEAAGPRPNRRDQDIFVVELWPMDGPAPNRRPPDILLFELWPRGGATRTTYQTAESIWPAFPIGRRVGSEDPTY